MMSHLNKEYKQGIKVLNTQQFRRLLIQARKGHVVIEFSPIKSLSSIHTVSVVYPNTLKKNVPLTTQQYKQLRTSNLRKSMSSPSQRPVKKPKPIGTHTHALYSSQRPVQIPTPINSDSNNNSSP